MKKYDRFVPRGNGPGFLAGPLCILAIHLIPSAFSVHAKSFVEEQWYYITANMGKSKKKQVAFISTYEEHWMGPTEHPPLGAASNAVASQMLLSSPPSRA